MLRIVRGTMKTYTITVVVRVDFVFKGDTDRFPLYSGDVRSMHHMKEEKEQQPHLVLLC